VTTNGSQVCAVFASGDLICADMDGKRLWAKNIGVPQNHYGYASSLLSVGNTLFIQYDNSNALKVMALDMATGAERWSKTRAEKNASWSSPVMITVNNSPQLILIGNPGVTSYNPATGEQNWRVECMMGEPTASPTFFNGVVYAAAENATMTAINAADGSILWQNNEFLPEIASPVASKDFVFIATTYGVVASFNAQTGELIKYLELEADFNSSPIIVDDKIYVAGRDGKVFVRSAVSDIALITAVDTGEPIFATPAFTDKKIVIRSDKSIYCVEAK
jgi:outer membrane protein assembly factor BamB